MFFLCRFDKKNSLMKMKKLLPLIITLLIFATICCEKEVENKSITLDQTTLSLKVGEEYSFKVSITPPDIGDPSWQTSNKDVVSVNNKGKIKAISIGKATITVYSHDNTLQSSCEVTVEATEATEISLNIENLKMLVDEEYVLEYTFTPKNTTNKEVTWSSSNPDIATVDNEGKVKALKIGETTITVFNHNKTLESSCTISVESEDGEPGNDGTLKLNLATYNVRLITSSDKGDRAWENRLPWVKKIIQRYDFDIIGTQEGFISQIEDIITAGNYDYIGVGRDDGKNKGETSAIVFKKDRFKVLDKGNFWLSETPDRVSTGWGATYNRILSWGRFKDKETEKEFYVFNAHYDHQSKLARKESSKLVVRKINEIAGNNPVFFTGDLNCLPSDDPISIILDFGLLDSRHSSIEPVYGTEGTFHGYNFDGRTTSRIDYIFVSKTIRIQKYGVINDDIELAKFSSDHFPVLVNAEL